MSCGGGNGTEFCSESLLIPELDVTNAAAKADSTQDIIRYTIYIIEGLLLAPSNLFVLFTILRYPALRNQKDYLIVGSLCFADSLSGLAAMCAGPYRINLILNNQHKELVSRWHCFFTAHNILWIVAFPMQGICLCLISVDRLFAVLQPLKYITTTKRYAVYMIGLSYAYGFIQCGVSGYRVSFEITPNVSAICLTAWGMLEFDYQFIYAVQLLGIFLSMGGYAIIVMVVILRNKDRKKAERRISDTRLKSKLKRQRQLTKSLGISCIFTFILFGCPNIAIWLATLFKYQMYSIITWAYIINNINPMLNPIIYYTRQKDLKMGMKAVLGCKMMPFDLSQWKGATFGGPSSGSAITNKKSSTARIVRGSVVAPLPDQNVEAINHI